MEVLGGRYLDFKAVFPDVWEQRMALETAVVELFKEFPSETMEHERNRDLALIGCWEGGIAMLALRMHGTNVPIQRFTSILMLLGLDTQSLNLAIDAQVKAKLFSSRS